MNSYKGANNLVMEIEFDFYPQVMHGRYIGYVANYTFILGVESTRDRRISTEFQFGDYGLCVSRNRQGQRGYVKTIINKSDLGIDDWNPRKSYRVYVRDTKHGCIVMINGRGFRINHGHNGNYFPFQRYCRHFMAIPEGQYHQILRDIRIKVTADSSGCSVQ